MWLTVWLVVETVNNSGTLCEIVQGRVIGEC